LEDPSRLQPAARELLIQHRLDGGPVLRGILDRLDEAAGGDLRVVDYKTGKSPTLEFERAALFQLKFYALLLWRTRGRIPRELRFYYLGDEITLVYRPEEHELRGFERTVRALWAAIERATRSGAWRARRSRLCDWCDHRAICPEWGGTPPPLPAPRQVDTPHEVPGGETPAAREARLSGQPAAGPARTADAGTGANQEIPAQEPPPVRAREPMTRRAAASPGFPPEDATPADSLASSGGMKSCTRVIPCPEQELL
jgi:putative RecB family exonuclease